jgi:hypothetical protein
MRFSLCVSSLVLIGIVSMPSVSAQETRGARFNFAANTWKAEQSRVPKGYGDYADPQHNVHSGAVPSKNVLGLDPMMLSKPAPMPPAVVTPAKTQVTAQASVPKITPSFSPLFGNPEKAIAQLSATLPQQAIAKPMTQSAPVSAPTHNAPVARHSSASRGVHARLMTPVHHDVAPVAATPAVASYGKNFGYVPGPLLPTSSGGMSARAEVSGRIIHHR